MPRAQSIDRGYLDLPSAYYQESPRRATFATGTADKLRDDVVPDSPIKKAWNVLHERRKSRAEVEEDQWFGGLVDIEETERKRREMYAFVLGVLCMGCLGWAWFVWG